MDPMTTYAGERNPNWGGDTLTYSGAHQRVRRTLGPASAQTCACGKPAAHWSYIYAPDEQPVTRPYSTDPARYRAQCVGCHRAYDHAHHPEGARRRKKLSDAQVADALLRINNGESRRSVARSLNVTRQALGYWLNRTTERK